MEWGIRIILLLAALPFVLYFVALSKNISRTEKENKRDMTYELNPFTGTEMPMKGEKKEGDK